MYQSKLIETLKVLSATELNRLDKYVRSPYFNPNKDIIRLFELIKPYHPTFASNRLAKEMIYEALFPEETYKDDKLRKIRNYLLDLVYGFLAQEKRGNDKFVQHLAIIQGLDSLGLKEEAKRLIPKGRKLYSKPQKLEVDYFEHQFLLEILDLEFSFAEHSRPKEKSFEKVLLPLDLYYLLNKLRLGCSLFNRAKIVDEIVNMAYWEHFLTFASHAFENYKKNLDQHTKGFPLVYTYYLTLSLFKKGDSYYENFKTYVQEFNVRWVDHYRLELMGYGVNFCIRKCVQGEITYLEEMFFWYKQLAQQQLISTHSSFFLNAYKNMVTLGLSLKAFDWTENIIENHKENLPESYREIAVSYNLANLYFHQQKYQLANKELLKVIDFPDPFYKISTDILRIKLFYEMDKEEVDIIRLCKNLEKYISRDKKLAGNKKTAYKKFCRLTRKLLDARHDRVKLAKFETELKKHEFLHDKVWLEEKIQTTGDR